MLDDALQSTKLKLFKKSLESWHCASKTKIVGQADPARKRYARMIGIQLPGMNIEIGWNPLTVQGLNIPLGESIGIDPEISSPGTGPDTTQGLDRGHGKFA
jgi:hypothetical protein